MCMARIWDQTGGPTPWIGSPGCMGQKVRLCVPTVPPMEKAPAATTSEGPSTPDGIRLGAAALRILLTLCLRHDRAAAGAQEQAELREGDGDGQAVRGGRGGLELTAERREKLAHLGRVEARVGEEGS